MTWSTENSDIVDILGVFSDAGIEYADKDSISVRIKALNPGKAKIVATVITPNGRQSCSVEVVGTYLYYIISIIHMYELRVEKNVFGVRCTHHQYHKRKFIRAFIFSNAYMKHM